MQPAMLSNTGMDYGAVMAATCLSSAVACFVMALLANYPIALAPAVGLNVYFTFTVCIAMKIPWQTALGAVFLSGVIFIVLGCFGLRKMVIDCIPPALKFGIAVGIGVMIALLGFEWAGVVVNDEVTLVKVGSLTAPYVFVAGLGLLTSMTLTSLHIRGAILFGMLVSGLAALGFDLIEYRGLVSTPPSLAPTFLAMNPLEALQLGIPAIIFTFFIIDLFDTVGTLVGVAEIGGFMKNDELPRARQALLSDAIGTVTGSMLGTSTVTSYVESCSGISDGARTGLANIVTGSLMIVTLFFYPLVEMLGQSIESHSGAKIYPIIAPSLIMVGFMMMKGVRHIPWEDYTESIPAFITIMLIGFSFSITEGIAFGTISYVLLKILTGNMKDIHPFMAIIALVFAWKLLFA